MATDCTAEACPNCTGQPTLSSTDNVICLQDHSDIHNWNHIKIHRLFFLVLAIFILDWAVFAYMADFLSLFVFEYCTLKFSYFLMSIGCVLSFKENIVFICLFSKHFLANFRLKYSLLSSSVSIFTAPKLLWFFQKRDVLRNFWRDRIYELGPWLARAVRQNSSHNFVWQLGPIRGLVYIFCPSRNLAWHLSFYLRCFKSDFDAVKNKFGLLIK